VKIRTKIKRIDGGTVYLKKVEGLRTTHPHFSKENWVGSTNFDDLEPGQPVTVKLDLHRCYIEKATNLV
jgi:hypothetical protein